MLFPKDLLNLQNQTISLTRFPFYKRVSYKDPYSNVSLKNYFNSLLLQRTIRGNGFSTYYLIYILTLCKLPYHGNIYKMIHRKERCITKNVSENKIQNIVL
jgi:hypothetical protein